MRAEQLKDPQSLSTSELLARLPDRFLIEHKLGEGGFGNVYAVRDQERGELVALKVLHELSAKNLLNFKEEFRALTRLVHRHLVTLYELLSHEGLWFFTMELLRGHDLLSYLRGGQATTLAPTCSGSFVGEELGLEPTQPFDTSPDLSDARPSYDEAALRESLRQLFIGVRALHEAGILHRDIKPSNVLVTEDDRVVLLDFGLISKLAPSPTLERARQLHQSNPVQFVGTPHYMSPEQAMGLPLDATSDWYSLGALLYEVLTGRRPIEGKSALQILLRKQSFEPPHVLELAPDAPEDLADLAMALLERDRDQRPSTEELARRLGVTQAARVVRAGRAPSRDAFVGRASHLSELRGAVDALRMTKRASVLHVHGASGIGKSALVRRFLDDLHDFAPDVLVLEGRCFENESVPYKALDNLIDMISRYLELQPASVLDELLSPQVAALAQLFPTLERLPGLPRLLEEVTTQDSRQRRQRAFEGLRELLGALAASQPVLLHIDDVQWGDEDSAQLLEHVLRPPNAPAVLLVATWRSEDRDTSPFLRAFLPMLEQHRDALPCHELPLAELEHSEASALVSALLTAGEERHRAEQVTAILDETHGNPLFIAELVRHVRAEGQLGSSINGLEDVLSRRILELPDKAQRLLEVVSVAAGPLARAIAREAAALTRGEQNALAMLRAELLLRSKTDGASEHLEAYHARIRETVVARMDTARRRATHAALAEALERARGDAESIARHHLAAAQPERALPHLVEAAHKAARALAFERAATLWRQALEHGDWSAAERSEILERLGDLHGYMGHGVEAAQFYREAQQGTSPRQARDLERRAAIQLLRAGRVDEGFEAMSRLLERFGLRTPQGASLIARLVALRARISLRGIDAGALDAASADALDDEQRERIELLWGAAQMLSAFNFKLGAYFGAHHLLQALDTRDPDHLSLSLTLESLHQRTSDKGRARAEALLRRAEALAPRARDRGYCEGFCAFGRGMLTYYAGRWEVALRHFQRAEHHLEHDCTGVTWELAGARFYQAMCYESLGRFEHFIERLPHRLDEALSRQDLLYATNWRLWSHRTHLCRDDPDMAQRALDLAMRRWPSESFDMQHYWHLLGSVRVALYEGDAARAADLLDANQSGLKRSLLLHLEIIKVLVEDLRGRVAVALLAHDRPDRRRARQLRAQAEQSCANLRALDIPTGSLYADLLSAQLSWLDGEIRTCVEQLAQVEHDAAASSNPLQEHTARLWRGHLLGSSTQGEALRGEATSWMQARDIQNPTRMMRLLLPAARLRR